MNNSAPTDYKNFLLKLHKNLNILKEREAKHAGRTPLDLLNQIEDHQKAIDLTEQAIAGELSQAQWLEALSPLLLAGQGTDSLTVWILTKCAFDQGLALGREIGPQASKTAQEIFNLSMDHLRHTPKGELIAAEFEQDPATYEKPVEKELGQLIQVDSDFTAQLKTLLEQFQQALKVHNAASSTTYRAAQSGSGLIAQGEVAIGIKQGDQGKGIIGGSGSR